jgi:acetate kinase
VREAIAQHSARARLAYDQFIWSLRRSIGAMVAVLGGVDALVFTGGIGENDAGVRGDVADALTFGGLRLRTDDDGAGDRLLSTSDSAIAALVVHAREDLVILDEVRNALRRPEEP